MNSSTSLPEGEAHGRKSAREEQKGDAGQTPSVTPGSYYGYGIPYLPIEGYPGKIIAIEGTDGVGRSTQIGLLREWLEVQGYGVVETGWARSQLMQPTIELAKGSNTLNKLTFVLLYATDFADRLEKEIIPALKAGFIVLTDRYVFTAMARAGVRGVDRTWIRSLYGFAIAPHLVFYLKTDEKTLIRRVLQARGMEYWESGMDMKLGDDIYESFRAYQRALLREYASMSEEFGFRVLDARRKIEVIQDELRRQKREGFTGSNPIPTECERVLRGGAFNYPASGLRASNRVHHPGRYRLVMSGFRCAKDAEEVRAIARQARSARGE